MSSLVLPVLVEWVGHLAGGSSGGSSAGGCLLQALPFPFLVPLLAPFPAGACLTWMATAAASGTRLMVSPDWFCSLMGSSTFSVSGTVSSSNCKLRDHN